MDAIREAWRLISSVEGLTELIRWGGLPILFAIVFAETGLFIGFCLPGDSLLVTAGFVAATTNVLDIGSVILFLCIAAIAGDATGYWIGRRAGEALYSREDSRVFKQRHLQAAREFYEKHGPIAIVLARFVPIARTFAPVVAGIAKMDYRRFAIYNMLGGVGWVVSLSLLGYFFGQIPFVQRHIEKAILLIIFVSLLPIVIPAAKAWWGKRRRS